MPLFVEGLAGSGSGASRAPAADRSGADGGAPTSGVPSGVPSFRHLARAAAEALGVTRAALWVQEANGGLLCLTRFHRGTLEQEDNRRYPEELGASFRFFLDRAAMVAMSDARSVRGRSDPFQDWLEAEGIRSLLALPVRARGRLAGWITFEEEGEPRRWSEGDRSRALEFAGQLSGVLAFGIPGQEEEANGAGSEGNGRPPGPASSPAGTAGPPAEVPRAPPPSPEPNAPAPGTRKEVRGRIRPLPGLEGAALLGGESAGELLHLLEIQSGYLGLLEEVVAGTPEDRELVQEARGAGERVRDGLVAFLRSLREGIPGRETLDVTGFLGEISSRLARDLGDGYRLRLAPASEILRVRGNPRLLERAMMHLIRNAREASEPGSTIRISWGRWQAPNASPSDPGSVRILVEDQGGGIPAQALPWVFEPFFSGGGAVPGERIRPEPGRGLGLPVVQAVIEGHGGWVDLRSRPGEGTQVALHLPLAALEADMGVAGSGEPDRAPGLGEAPRILVLEDEPLLARLLDRILTRSGFRVTVVEAPEDAGQVWRNLDGDVDLVIVERTLTGGRSGPELTEPWRRERPGLRVMVLDRNAPPPADGEEGPGSVAGLPLLTRPFQPADVVGAVRRILAEGKDPDVAPEGRGGEGTDPGTGTGRPGGVVLH